MEHHLWPGMSFVKLREASEVLRSACKEPPGAVFLLFFLLAPRLDLPYHEIGYWEAFGKATWLQIVEVCCQVWQQVRDHAAQPE